MSRREDYRLRSAIDCIHTQINVLTTINDVYEVALNELMALTESELALVLTPITGATGPDQWNVEIFQQLTMHSTTSCAPDQHLGFPWRRLYAKAIDEHTPLFFADRSNILPAQWPSMNYVAVIPLVEKQRTKALFVLANNQVTYSSALSKRLWPFLTSCLRAIRSVGEHNFYPELVEATPFNADFLTHALMQCSKQPIVEVNENLRICEFNQAAERAFAMNATRAIGEEITLLLPERFPNQHRIQTFVSSAENDKRELSNVIAAGANGDLFFVDLIYFSYQKKLQTYYTLVLTVKQFAEQENTHAESPAWLQLIRSAPVGMLYLDCKGRCQYANRQWRDATGLTPQEILGRHWREIPELTDLDDIERRSIQHLELRGRSAQLESSQISGNSKHHSGKATLVTLTLIT